MRSRGRLSRRLRALVLLPALVLGSFSSAAPTPAAGPWVQQNVTTPSALGPIVYDNSLRGALMFNGTETWKWDTAAATWTNLAPAHEPVMLGGDYAMAFDWFRSVAVLIVSAPTTIPNPGDTLSTWQFDGTDWVQMHPVHSPPPRFDHSQNLAFDSFHARIVLFSGQFNTDFRLTGDTWQWDGIDWTQNTTAGGSVQRFGHCMAFDTDRNHVVMRGGEENHGSGISDLFFDTWQYDGTTWTGTNDPNTFYHNPGCSLTYDPEISRTIDLSTNGATGLLTPFYWDGASWVMVGPDGPGLVTWRSVYDFDHNVVVVVGATSLAGSTQTWVLNPLPGPLPGPVPVITSLSPDHGPAAGGTTVTITGQNLTGVTAASFRAGSALLQPCGPTNPSPYCFTVNSDTQITALSTPQPVGTSDFYLVNANGFSATTPSDVYTSEGWDIPTPNDNSTITAPMTNPPQQTTFKVKLLETGTPSIGFSITPSTQTWLTCLGYGTPEVDCTADPTDLTQISVTFFDSVNSTRVPTRTVNVHVVHTDYRPNPDGYNFKNQGDSLPNPLDIQADYPLSFILYPGGTVLTARAAVFYALFQNFTSGGLCYGYAASSAFYFRDASGAPVMPYTRFPNPATQINGESIRTVIERFHSRQLAEVGAIDSIGRYDAASNLGNLGVFNQLANQPRGWIETIGIVPSKALATKDPGRYKDYFLGSHMVLAYDTVPATPGTDLGKIKVYDPDSPNDPNALITITQDGGMTLAGSGAPGYGSSIGKPTDWLAVPIPDLTWLDNTVEVSPTLQTLDNRHWILDAPLALAFALGVSTTPINVSPVPIMSGGTKAQIGTLPAGGSLSGTVSTTALNALVGEFSGSHVATTTETDPGAVGTSHQLTIDPAASSIHLSGASSAQQYTLQLGADLQQTFGRRVTLTGVGLAPNATVDMKTDANMNGFTLSSSGTSQTVAATIEQLGQGSGSVNVQVSIPGGGAQAAITVYNWTDLTHSLIYETTTQANGQQTVTILQDNPAQRKAQVDGLYQQLLAAISTISDPIVVKALTVAVQASEYLYHAGDSRDAALILIGVERVVALLSGTKIPASTAAAIIALSQQIRGLM